MASARSNPRPGRGGYTLVEVLIVVTIIGIATAVVVPQMLTAGTLGVQAAARIVVADMLFAQNEAIARQRPVSIVFDQDNERYSLLDDTGAILSVRWKNGTANNYVVDFTTDSRFQGVVIASANFGAGNQALVFDALGGPSSGGTVEIEFQNTRYRVTVAAFTGRVTVQEI
jgi:prepilin-type N-terminal cleavage/methylation domain-containing protein